MRVRALRGFRAACLLGCQVSFFAAPPSLTHCCPLVRTEDHKGSQIVGKTRTAFRNRKKKDVERSTVATTGRGLSRAGGPSCWWLWLCGFAVGGGLDCLRRGSDFPVTHSQRSIQPTTSGSANPTGRAGGAQTSIGIPRPPAPRAHAHPSRTRGVRPGHSSLRVCSGALGTKPSPDSFGSPLGSLTDRAAG